VTYAIGEIARLARVSVRTLHHYDEIGLLVPGERGANGYRRYDDVALERLQQIRYYRELGFALEEVATLLDDPNADAMTHLRRQHRLLRERLDQTARMIQAIEYAMEAQQMNIPLTPEERFEVFGEHDPGQYGAEIEERWGNTEAFKEARRRVQRYSKDDWLSMKAEGEAPVEALVAARQAGLPPTSTEAMDAAEAHRQHISRWFYDCGLDVHQGLGEMYVADERFRATYDDVEAGLAEYLRDAILANAARQAA